MRKMAMMAKQRSESKVFKRCTFSMMIVDHSMVGHRMRSSLVNRVKYQRRLHDICYTDICYRTLCDICYRTFAIRDICYTRHFLIFLEFFGFFRNFCCIANVAYSKCLYSKCREQQMSVQQMSRSRFCTQYNTTDG